MAMNCLEREESPLVRGWFSVAFALAMLTNRMLSLLLLSQHSSALCRSGVGCGLTYGLVVRLVAPYCSRFVGGSGKVAPRWLRRSAVLVESLEQLVKR